MPNSIPDSEVSGTDMHSASRGSAVTDAVNRAGVPLDDHTLFLDGAAFDLRQIVGTWTIGLGANGVVEIAKAAAAEVGHVIAQVNEATRLAAERGLRLTGANLFFTIATAALTDLQLLLVDYDGSVLATNEPGRAVVAGNSDAHYDVANDTAGKRGAIAAAKKLTVTVPVPASYLGGYHATALEILATDPGTSVFTVHGATLRFQRVDIDVVTPS